MKSKKENKFVLILILLLLYISLVPTGMVYAEESSDKEIIKVGFYQFDGYHNQSEDGILSGYGYEFLRMIAGYTDWEYQYVGYDKTWDDMFEMLDTGEIDMLTSAQYTEERAEKYDYSESPIGYSEAILTTNTVQDKLIQGDYDSYENMRVGMMKGSSQNEKMFQFAKTHNFTIEPVYYETQEQLQDALQKGEDVDAIVTTSIRCLRDEVVLERFDRAPYYVIVKKSNTELMDKINFAINKLNTDDTDWMEKLYNKYYSVNDSYLYLNPEEKEYLNTIKESGKTVTVLINPDLKPYSYYENNEPKGILVDYFKEICNIFGLQSKYIQIENAEEYIDAAITHKADLVLAPFFETYEPDQDGYNLTQAFLSASICMINRNGEKQKEGLSGEKIALVTGMSSLEPAAREEFQEAEYVFYPTADACIEAVKNKEVEGTLLYSYTAYRYLNQNWENELELHEIPYLSVGFSIAVSKECDKMMYILLNKAIHMIPESQIDEIVLPTLFETNTEIKSLYGQIVHNPKIWKSLFGSIAVLIVIISIYVNKKRIAVQRKKRKKAEYEALRDPLTGVFNRQGYIDALSRFKNDQRPFAYIQIDVDNFKNINDTYGHTFGDEVLKTVAKELAIVFRQDDYVFRFGGDEFAVLLVNCKSDAWDSISQKQRLLHINIKSVLDTTINVTLSMGICWSEHGMTENIIALADAALYQAKRNGRAGCCVYDQNYKSLFEWKDATIVMPEVNPFAQSNTGSCRIELKQQGLKGGRLICDETARILMGFSENMTPEECFEAWLKRIDSSDRENITKTRKVMMEQGQAECTYLYHHPIQGPVMFRSGGRSSQDEDKIIFVGYHQSLRDTRIILHEDDT